MKLILDRYHSLLKGVLTLLLAVMIVPVVIQIASRLTNLIPHYIWTEEAARFCFVWIIMIGSMIAVRDGRHFKVDLLPKPQTPREEGTGRLVVHIAMSVMALLFTWYGWDFAAFGWSQNSEMSGINMLSIYISFPLAGITWLIFLIEKMAEDVRMILNGDAGADACTPAK